MPSTDDHIVNMDVQVQYKGNSMPVYVDDTLSASGWRGGQWVKYISNTVGNVKNVRVVDASDGVSVAGFLVRGSDFHPQIQQPGGWDLRNSEYNYSSYKPTNTRVVTMIFEGSFIFKVYEKFAFPNRDSGTSLVYTWNTPVAVSDRGYLTTVADATASGIVTPFVVGYVWLVPSEDNEYSLGVDMRLF
jgi:hypothetical protein